MAIHAYTHIQTVEAPLWTVTHNLNTNAINLDVAVIHNGVNEKIFPNNIEAQDTNTIIVSFTSAYTGSVRIIGLPIS